MSTIVDDGRDVVDCLCDDADCDLATDGSMLLIPMMVMSLQLMMQMSRASMSSAAATGEMMVKQKSRNSVANDWSSWFIFRR